MRKLVTSILFATVAGALTFGAAASLTVTSDQIGSGSTGVMACDPDGVNVSYNSDPGELEHITSVTISGIDAACDGQTISIVISTDVSAIIATAGGALNADPSQDFVIVADAAYAAANGFGVPDRVLAASIGEVAVTIAG